LPPVLYGQAEAGRHRRPGGPVPPTLRAEDILNTADVERWLALYGRAWETKDPGAAAEIFSENATYQETPFEQVMRGRERIRTYWAEVTGGHVEVSFGADVLVVGDGKAVANWKATILRPSGVRTTTDGVFVLEFDDDGRCRSLREWWHRDPPTF
jgi:uncharacterized protein (TIGR02246 family)